jgi:hypothetical protein
LERTLLKASMSGPDYPEHPADGIRSTDEKRSKSRKFIGVAATCLILIACLAYVSHLLSGRHFSLFDFSGLVLFLLFIVVVDRIIVPQIGALPPADQLVEPSAEQEKIGALLDGLPADCVVLHNVNSGQGNIDHLVFRKDGAVFLIEDESNGGGTPGKGKPFEKGMAGHADQNALWLQNHLKTRFGFEPWIHAAIVFPSDAGSKSHFKVRGVSVVSPETLLIWMNQASGDRRMTATLWPQVEQLKRELSRLAPNHLAPPAGLR